MWSDAVIHEVFSEQGFDIEMIEYPAKRLSLSLHKNLIDTYLGSTKSLGNFSTDFIRSDLPVSVVDWYIYYDHRNNWTPSWPPDAVFRKKIGKSKLSSESFKNEWNLNISQSANEDSIVKMVNLGRADYWLENRTGARTLSEGLLRSSQQGFTYSVLLFRPLFVFF